MSKIIDENMVHVTLEDGEMLELCTDIHMQLMKKLEERGAADEVNFLLALCTLAAAQIVKTTVDNKMDKDFMDRGVSIFTQGLERVCELSYEKYFIKPGETLN